MKNAIETFNLTKVYNNNFTAVNSLNFEIPTGTIAIDLIIDKGNVDFNGLKDI
mgnify:CR=1 FL=1